MRPLTHCCAAVLLYSLLARWEEDSTHPRPGARQVVGAPVTSDSACPHLRACALSSLVQHWHPLPAPGPSLPDAHTMWRTCVSWTVTQLRQRHPSAPASFRRALLSTASGASSQGSANASSASSFSKQRRRQTKPVPSDAPLCRASERVPVTARTVPHAAGPLGLVLFVPSVVCGYLAHWQFQRSDWKVCESRTLPSINFRRTAQV